MRTIPVPHDLVCALRYDPKTGELLWRVAPKKSKSRGNVAGCLNRQGYVVVTFRGHQYGAHRIAWRLLYGIDAPGMIDHIDGDRSNNRSVNLRVATAQQNAANRRLKAGKLLPKGVHETGNVSRPYRATVCVDGCNIHLGTFRTATAASEAYEQAANSHFGAFSKPSRPETSHDHC